jgi:hypothetical protein
MARSGENQVGQSMATAFAKRVIMQNQVHGVQRHTALVFSELSLPSGCNVPLSLHVGASSDAFCTFGPVKHLICSVFSGATVQFVVQL